MTKIEITVASEEATDARRAEGAERLAKIANELRSLHRAEQDAGFEMGKLLCRVAGETFLRINLPLREDRHDVALWAKREVGLSYSRTAQLMDGCRVKDALDPGLNEPATVAQTIPLRPLLKHGAEGRRLMNAIWEKACVESNRAAGPSRSLVAKIAKAEAPELVGKKRKAKKMRLRDVLVPLHAYLRDVEESGLEYMTPKEAQGLYAILEEIEIGVFGLRAPLHKKALVSRALD